MSDTQKSVTAEAAAVLVEGSLGKVLEVDGNGLAPDVARVLAKHSGGLRVLAEGLRAETAKVLQAYAGESIELAKGLCADAAGALAGYKGDLQVEGSDLVGSTAKALAKSRSRRLIINKELTVEAAGGLADYAGAIQLATYSPTAQVARALSNCRATQLDITDGLYMDDRAAEKLANFKGLIKVPLNKIRRESARALAARRGPVCVMCEGWSGTMNDLAERDWEDGDNDEDSDVSTQAKKAALFGEHQGHLILRYPLNSEEGFLAESLARHRGSLELFTSSLEKDDAEVVACHKGPLSVTMEHVDFKVDEMLAEHEGKLRVSSIYLGDFSKHRGPLSLSFYDVFNASDFEYLAKYSWPLEVDYSTLSEENALALAPHKAELRVITRDLTAGMAKGLAGHAGSGLALSCGMPVEAAAALASYGGRLEVEACKGLTPEAIAAIARRQGPLSLLLPVLGEDAAKALADYKGRELVVWADVLTPEAAAVLSRAQGLLVVTGFEQALEKTGSFMDEESDPLVESGVVQGVSPTGASVLARYCRNFSAPEVRPVSAERLEMIAEGREGFLLLRP